MMSSKSRFASHRRPHFSRRTPIAPHYRGETPRTSVGRGAESAARFGTVLLSEVAGGWVRVGCR